MQRADRWKNVSSVYPTALLRLVIITRIQPYHLLYNGSMVACIRLLGFFSSRYRRLQLNYIKRSLTKKQFSGGDDFDVKKHIGMHGRLSVRDNLRR